MRLGGPVFEKYETPDQWVEALRRWGYRTGGCPVSVNTPVDIIREYAVTAEKADIVISEVGAWSNPLSPNDAIRTQAIEKCKQSLALADAIGARCCVNIAGSRGEKWDGPCADDLTEETFDMIVEVVRNIIDDVKPLRTYYTLETMPWMYPDSADSYLRLIRAIDRKHFAVHFDPVNLVNSPQRYFQNGELIRDFIARLGPYIRSCHAKDILLGDRLTVHLEEVCPGKGALDYRTYLRELSKLDRDVPLILEHLHGAEEYRYAGEYIRGIARELGCSI
jgi:sugar phosphate isomerase/epimerase